MAKRTLPTLRTVLRDFNQSNLYHRGIEPFGLGWNAVDDDDCYMITVEPATGGYIFSMTNVRTGRVVVAPRLVVRA